MAIFKCKMCGGALEITEGSCVAECQYCGSVQTVPTADNEKMLTLFTRANRLRANCEFDKAFGVYEAIVAEFPEEAEAYWGLVLCKYGIEYVDDPATAKKIPTCHRSSFDSVMEDPNFEQALEYTDAIARKIYREEAKQIEELRKGILEVSQKADPYDIFICYKETADNGERTLDSVLAQDIYDTLTDKGYKVFFSRITLEDKLGQEYEPYIFAALNSAKIMLVVGTDYEYFNAVWVRNEWSRYLKIIETDKSKHLIPCFKGIDAYDMPKEFAKLQAQDLGKVGAIQDLMRGIDKLISPATTVSAQATNQGANTAELLAQGNSALEEGNWDAATNWFNLALIADVKCTDAYLGKLLADLKLKHREDLVKSKKPLKKYRYYDDVLTFANDSLKKELEDYENQVLEKRKARKKRNVIIAVAASIVAVISAWIGIEINYRGIINDFYAGTLSAENTQAELANWEWYKSPDKCTASLIKYRTSGAAAMGDFIIPDGVTHIAMDLFNGCRISSVTIPESVTSIGNWAFSGCASLESVYISDIEAWCRIKFYDFSANPLYYAKNLYLNDQRITDLVIPDGVTEIKNNVFYNFTGLKSITIPDSVTSIGDYAFSCCESLTSITIPNSVTSIGKSAFSSCENLTSITIPNSVTSVGDYAFHNCSGLTDIKISNGVTSIGTWAFNNCTGLKSITIPDSVTSIGARAFAYCNRLTTVIIPDSVTRMADRVFDSCKLSYVYCEATNKPENWNSAWQGGCGGQIVWGYSK